jgi:hypothetical protein
MKTNFNQSIAKKSALALIVTVFTAFSVSALAPVTAENQLSAMPRHLESFEYQSIKVTITDKSVILDWNTASELRSNYFEVERSSDMNEFKTVALVLDGFTTGGTGKRYAFKEDVSVAKNGKVAYYRLKQFDANGIVSYSSVVKAQQTPSVN